MDTNESSVLTIAEFCEKYKIDRVTLYNLRRTGRAPDEIHIGKKILFSSRACLEWERRMEERAREEGVPKRKRAVAA